MNELLMNTHNTYIYYSMNYNYLNASNDLLYYAQNYAGIIGGSLLGRVLIALDKCSGVHIISDGEVLLCILCKVVALATQNES